MRNPRSVLITGASSGIGKALAEAYAAPDVTLALCGRNKERLDAVAEVCTAKGAAVETVVLDVTDEDALGAWVGDVDADLVIANAGISAGTGGIGEPADQVRRIFDVNLNGVLNTALPAIDRMLQRPRPGDGSPRGQIALMASIAAFRGFAGAPAYCASKAAVKSYAEGLRNAYVADGISVNVICPGFVRSPMTDVNKFAMPMLMDAERAASIIKRGLANNRGRIAFPGPMYFLAWLLQTLPPTLTDRLIQRLPEKGAEETSAAP